ncbi:hypothetical protein ACQV2X_07730 [Facklamia sp. P12945]|uniref:hypothetical protein n=1 Tax=unclassified Facklamia TaxID=2622293 RepID=UPI003D170FBC
MYFLCTQYIDSEDSNLNYVDLISDGISELKEFEIDAKLKLKAKEKSSNQKAHLFSNGGLKLELLIHSSKKLKDLPENWTNNTFTKRIFIDKDWLIDNNDL